MEMLQSSYIAGGDINDIATVEKFGSSSFKAGVTIWHRNKTCPHKIHSWMFISLVIIAPKYKQPKYSSTDKWLHEMWYIYIMEYYSAIKGNEVQMDATYRWTLKTWRIQSQKVTCYIILSLWNAQKKWIYRQKMCKRLLGTGVPKERRECPLMETGLLSGAV